MQDSQQVSNSLNSLDSFHAFCDTLFTDERRRRPPAFTAIAPARVGRGWGCAALVSRMEAPILAMKRIAVTGSSTASFLFLAMSVMV